jgi:hypothetical protein
MSYSFFRGSYKSYYFLLAIDNNQVIGSIEYGPVSKLIIDLTNGTLKDFVEVGTVTFILTIKGIE